MKNIVLIVSIILTLAGGSVFAQTTDFTYQGRLLNASAPANGNYDFEFALFDAATGGTQIGSTISQNSLTVTDGNFSVKLDFGANFPGANRFLEIRVRQTGGGGFVTLTPRQAVTSAPYSVTSLNSANAANATTAATATNALQLGGVTANQYVTTTSGNASYIQNTTTLQAASNFNVGGTGTANIFNAGVQYNLNGQKILSSPGVDNILVGRLAGVSITSGSVNSFFGYRAGEGNIGGSSNSFFGERSGLNSQSINNSFFGAVSGQTNVSGGNNTIIGTLADVSAPNLNFATALGAGAVVSSSNTVVLGRSNDTVQIPGALNVAGTTTFTGTLGANIFNAATQFNIGGSRVLSVAGNNNTFVGVGAGSTNTTGENNSFFGRSAGEQNTEGFANSFFGRLAGLNNTTGAGNSFFGESTGPLNTTGGGNSFFGRVAGRYNTTGNGNSFFGDSAGLSNTTASLNSFFGSNAGLLNTVGTGNSFYGAGAGEQNTISNGNSYFGFNAGRLSTGGVNSFFGASVGQQNTTGSSNSFFGESAGGSNTTGNFNAFFGDSAGFSNTTGGNNTLIGNSANVSTGNLANATAIGANSLVSNSNSLVLGNNANVGIGISAPIFKLQIVDSLNTGLRVQTNTAGGTVGSFGGLGAFQIDSPGTGGGRFTVKENGNVGIGTNNPNTKLQVQGGSVYIANPNSLIITSPNGACWFITVNNSGALSTISVTCP